MMLHSINIVTAPKYDTYWMHRQQSAFLQSQQT